MTLLSDRNTQVFRTALTDLVPSDGELHGTRRVAHVPAVRFGDVYSPSERHMCYTLRSGCSYAEGVYTKPGFFGNATGAAGNHSYYLSFNDFPNYAFRLYSPLCIYVSI